MSLGERLEHLNFEKKKQFKDIKTYRKYLQASPCICRWVPINNSMQLYSKKTFILMTFRSPLDAASILKNPRINAGSEPEIVIKLFENYFFKKLFFF